ncbi:MAG: hypothetical protein ACM335_05995, partial [Deltaproteobacteria bacterium]
MTENGSFQPLEKSPVLPLSAVIHPKKYRQRGACCQSENRKDTGICIEKQKAKMRMFCMKKEYFVIIFLDTKHSAIYDIWATWRSRYARRDDE